MRIRSFRVGGLGMLVDTGVDQVEDGLVLIEGPNGAGKSTLMEFVNTIFFGFQKGNSAQKYPDTLGGQRGGAMNLVTKDGRELRWEISPSSLAGGSISVLDAGVAVNPASLLQGASRSLYDSVFALGIDDLRHDRNATFQEEMEAAITGMTLTGLPGAIRATDAAIKELAGTLRDLAAELKPAEVELAVAKSRSGAYDETVDRLRASQAALASVEEVLPPVKERSQRLDLLWQAWPSWCEYSDANAELAGLSHTGEFDPAALEKLSDLREREVKAKGELTLADQEIEDCREKIAALEQSPAIILHCDAIEALAKSEQSVREAAYGLENYAVEIVTREDEFRRQLASLGPDWDEPRLAGFDSSLPTQTAAATRATAVLEAQKSLEGARSDLKNRQDEAEIAESEVKRLATQIAEFSEAPPSPHLERKASAVQQVRLYLQNVTRLKAEIEGLESAGSQVPSPQLPETRIWILAVAVAVIVALAAIAVKAYGLILLGPVLGLLVLMVARSGRSTAIKPDTDAKRREQEFAQSKIHEACEREGWKVESEADLEGIEKELSGDRQRAHELELLSGRLTDSQGRAGLATGRVQSAASKVDEARTQLKNAAMDWAEWLSAHEYPAALEPESLQAFCSRLESAWNARSALAKALAERDALEGRIARARAGLCEVYAGIGVEPFTMEPAEAIAALARRLADANEAERNAQNLEREIGELHRAQIRIRQELEELNRKVAVLLEGCGATTDAEFEAAWISRKEAARLFGQMATAKTTLTALAGPSGGFEKLSDELSSVGSGHELCEEAAAAKDEATRMSNLRDEARDAKLRLERDVANLEQGADQQSALAKTAKLKAEIESVRTKWLESTMVRLLLSEAKEKFQDQVQSGVLERASHYMSKLTNGNSMHIRRDGGLYTLVDHDGRTRSVEQLNRSHCERLLLAIRLAYVDHYCDEKEPLPVVLDDVLVNFDPAHQQLAVDAILEFASRQQVLYLTCHPSTVELFRGCGKPFQHLRLSQWKFES